MSDITELEYAILSILKKLDGANYYRLGIHLSNMDVPRQPSQFTCLRDLLNRVLVYTEQVEAPIPVIWKLTEQGLAVMKEHMDWNHPDTLILKTEGFILYMNIQRILDDPDYYAAYCKIEFPQHTRSPLIESRFMYFCKRDIPSLCRHFEEHIIALRDHLPQTQEPFIPCELGVEIWVGDGEVDHKGNGTFEIRVMLLLEGDPRVSVGAESTVSTDEIRQFVTRLKSIDQNSV